MANVSFVLVDLNGNETKVERVLSYEHCCESDAACDSLRLELLSDKALEEQCGVYGYLERELVFSGIVDTQREELTDTGFRCFIYARSLAALLTDTQAKPCTFNCPSARAVWETMVNDPSLSYDLGDILCQNQLQVSNGKSKFGVLNELVYSIIGKGIRVYPNGNVSVLESRNTRAICSGIISERRDINRGNALAQIDYKLFADKDYIYHRESKLIKKKGIHNRVMKNLASVPDWQRETTLSSFMKRANDGYYTFEVVLDGYFLAEPMDKVVYNSLSFGKGILTYVNSVSHILDMKGERTKLTLYVPLELEEVSYVD